MATPRTFVEAPPVTPLPYGLFSAALVLDNYEGNQSLGTQYETTACGRAERERAACEADVDFGGGFSSTTAGEPGTGGLPLVLDHPYTAFWLLNCSPVGLSEDALEERARDNLRLGEQRAAEEQLAVVLAADPEAVDLTPAAGGALRPVEGLALLEGWSGDAYGGVPTIHVPRRVGALLSTNATERVGARRESAQGSLIASGGGYLNLQGPGGEAAPDGEAWMYVTGTTVVRRAAQADVVRLDTPRSVSAHAALNRTYALAMRPSSVSYECIAAAVRVTLTGTVDGGDA